MAGAASKDRRVSCMTGSPPWGRRETLGCRAIMASLPSSPSLVTVLTIPVRSVPMGKQMVASLPGGADEAAFANHDGSRCDGR